MPFSAQLANSHSARSRPRPITTPKEFAAAVLNRPIDAAFFCRPALSTQDDAKKQPLDFAPGAYGPELLKVMGSAFDAAWENFKPTPNDTVLARLQMASAIIEAVEAGAREPEVFTTKAVRALRAAIKSTQARLG